MQSLREYTVVGIYAVKKGKVKKVKRYKVLAVSSDKAIEAFTKDCGVCGVLVVYKRFGDELEVTDFRVNW